MEIKISDHMRYFRIALKSRPSCSNSGSFSKLAIQMPMKRIIPPLFGQKQERLFKGRYVA